MDLFGKHRVQNGKQMSKQNERAFQSALDDAEQSLEGDELQEAVKQKKDEQAKG